jgi:hypothetical protein
MMLNKEHGEFNFNMFENEKSKLQYQARFHEDSQAIHKLHYDIVSVKKLTRKQRKNRNYRLNRKTKALAGFSRGLGATESGPPS